MLKEINFKAIGLGLWKVIKWTFLIECIIIAVSTTTLYYNDYYHNSTCAVDQWLPEVLKFCVTAPLALLVSCFGVAVFIFVLFMLGIALKHLDDTYLIGKKINSFYDRIKTKIPTPSPKMESTTSMLTNIGGWILGITLAVASVCVVVVVTLVVVAVINQLLFGDIC